MDSGIWFMVGFFLVTSCALFGFGVGWLTAHIVLTLANQ